MEIGNSSLELRIKNNGKIYLQWGSKWIDVLDSEGNPNMKIKNLINSGTPTSSSNNGFYYDGDSIYLKIGNDIIDLSSTQLPEGSIIMYKGTLPPSDSGWYKYGDTNLDGVIYIINKSGDILELAEVTLLWNPSTNPIYTTIGESFTSPVLNKIVSKNVPLIINYTSSDTSKATIDGNGNVIIKAVGQTTIVANTEANSLHKAANASYLLIILEPTIIPVESISINPTTFELESGGTQLFTATVLPTNATTKSVTWRVTQGNATIDSSGKLTAGNVTTDTTVVVEAVSNDTSGSTRVSGTSRGTIKALEPESNVKSFKNIIDEFNATGIYSPNITSTGTTGLLYSYLDTMYNNAKSEYEGNSELFLSSTYENLEVYNYHGTNNQYELDGTAENAMFYWLIAMCLSELVPSDGSNNKLTRLFKFAYDLGKESGYGRKFRLYNNYTPKGDLTICRLVASVIYAKYRSNYKNLISTFRSNLGGRTISISGTLQDGLGLSGKIGSSPTKYGYSVDLDLIFPAAAGPYSTTGNYSNRAAYPKDLQGSDKDSFNNTTLNYTIDEAINNEVITNYNLVNNSNSTKFKRTILAISDDYEEVEHYLDDKIYYTYPDNPGNDVTYPHDRFTAATSSSNKGYFTGTFNNDVVTSKNLSLYKNSSNFTNFLSLMKNACAWNRQTTYWPLFGRRRPSQGTTEGSCANSGQHSNQNWLDDWGILNLAGGATKYDSNGNKYYVDANGNGIREENESSYYPHNCSNIIASTYPSGHSGGVWGAALALIELLSDMGITNSTEINNIYKAAYAFTVSRTIVRAHWNSDTIYGKLNTTTIFPVLHAMSTFDNIFNNAEQALNSTPITKRNIDIAYSSDWTSPRKSGIKGTIFNLPTLYIKENNTIYSSNGTSYTKYPYWDLLKQYITYKFEGETDTNYASINSTTGAVTLNSVTTGDGVRVGAYVGENSMFTTTDAHFYIKIVELAGDMLINVIIDNQTGADAYITGEILYFVLNSSGEQGTVYTCSDENIANDDGSDGHFGDGEPNNITLIKLTPGENLLHFSYVEYSYGFNRDNTPITFRTKNDDTKKKDEYGNIIKVSQKLRVYAHGVEEHERCAFTSTIESGNEFKEDNITYRIKIEKGTDYDLMYKPLTPEPTNTITLSQSSVSIPNSGGTSTITVTSSSSWTATSNSSWCTTSTSGNILTITASSGSETSRTATIIVSNGSDSKTITVIQAGSGSSDPLYTVGLMSDIHYNVPDSKGKIKTTGSATSSDNGSYYREDLSYIIDSFKYYNTVFNASPGDIATNSLSEIVEFTKDYIKDYTGIDTYTENSFLNNSSYKKFYCALGNHDHHVVYSDTSKCKYVNYNNGANTHDGQRWYSVTYNGSLYNCPGVLSGNVSYFSSNSKSYTITYNGDIYIFISAFYGDPRAESDDGAGHDMSQMHPHNLMTSSQISTLKSYILLKYNNTYIFPDNESNFNFLYYKYEDLIELKNIIESNSSSRIFVFSHYYFPNKSGGNNEYPGEGYSGGASTCLMGITFHFLNCLNNKFKNIIWFSGHTHLSWMYGNAKKGLHWTNTNYKYIVPTSSDNSSILTNYTQDFYAVTTGNTPYNRLTSEVDNNIPTCGWNVHLPSLSRPIDSSGKNLPACEAAVMFVYSDRIEIKKLGYTRNNDGTYTSYGSSIPDRDLVIYNDGTGTCNDTAPEISEKSTPTPSGDGITINITNNSSSIARLNGKLVFNITNGSRTSQENGYFPEYNSGYDNPITINPGETYSGIISSFAKQYTDSPEPSEFLNGSWSTQGGVNIYTYSAMYYGKNSADDKKDGEPHSSNGMYIVTSPSSNNIPITSGAVFSYNITNISKTDGTETIYPQEIIDNTHYYVLGPNGKLRRNGTDYTIVKGDPTGNATKSGVPNTA